MPAGDAGSIWPHRAHAHSGDASRRNAEGRGHDFIEKPHRLIVLGQDHEIAAAIVLDAALDRLEQDAGQPALRHPPQIRNGARLMRSESMRALI